MLTLDELRQHFVAADLEFLAPHVERLARRSIRLLPKPVDNIALGASRIGGWPDVPVGFKWPTYADAFTRYGREYIEDESAPLIFLAQLDWRALQPFDAAGVLPDAGGLLFFGGKIACSHVVAYAGDAVLAPATVAGSDEVLPLHSLEPRAEWTLPNYGFHGTVGGDEASFWDTFWPDLERLPLTREQDRRYDRIREELSVGPRPLHRVLGHADYEQNPLHFELECPAFGASTGKDWFDLNDANNPLTQRIKRSAIATDWQLLLQVDYFGDSEMFGDGGKFQFLIRRADLRAQKWDVVCDMQCG